ncbi:MAG: DUF1801 domain-containing protein [Planctomycetes bacterium]|nr:DUF1801 domain-containing protein [Planctomycetota bacterium]
MKPSQPKNPKSSKRTAKPSSRKPGAGPAKLLTGGNPQIPKGDGDEPVIAYIAAMPGWKSDVGRRLDELIVAHLPNVQKAVRWNSPFYGIEGQGWLVSFHVLTKYVQLNFFCGASLKPVPTGSGKDPNARWLNIYEGDTIDEAQISNWLIQAAKLPGWASFSS